MTIAHGCRSLVFLATLSLLPAFAGEPETAAPPTPKPAAVVPQVPGGSFVTMSDALRAEVLTKLSTIAQQKHSCSKLQIVDTRTRSVKGRVRLGNDGQLLAGTVTEIWKVGFCGTKASFTVVLTPPVEGASGVTISGRE